MKLVNPYIERIMEYKVQKMKPALIWRAASYEYCVKNKKSWKSRLGTASLFPGEQKAYLSCALYYNNTPEAELLSLTPEHYFNQLNCFFSNANDFSMERDYPQRLQAFVTAFPEFLSGISKDIREKLVVVPLMPFDASDVRKRIKKLCHELFVDGVIYNTHHRDTREMAAVMLGRLSVLIVQLPGMQKQVIPALIRQLQADLRPEVQCVALVSLGKLVRAGLDEEMSKMALNAILQAGGEKYPVETRQTAMKVETDCYPKFNFRQQQQIVNGLELNLWGEIPPLQQIAAGCLNDLAWLFPVEKIFSTVSALMDSLKNSLSPNKKREAVEALCKIPLFINEITTEDQKKLVALLYCLSKDFPVVVSPLLVSLSSHFQRMNEQASAEEMRILLNALVMCSSSMEGSLAVGELIVCLYPSSALPDRQKEELIQSLKKYTTHKEASVRCAATVTLARIYGPEAIQGIAILKETIESDISPAVCEAALRELQTSVVSLLYPNRMHELVQAVERKLRENEPRIRMTAATVLLGYLSSSASADILGQARKELETVFSDKKLSASKAESSQYYATALGDVETLYHTMETRDDPDHSSQTWLLSLLAKCIHRMPGAVDTLKKCLQTTAAYRRGTILQQVFPLLAKAVEEHPGPAVVLAVADIVTDCFEHMDNTPHTESVRESILLQKDFAQWMKGHADCQDVMLMIASSEMARFHYREHVLPLSEKNVYRV